ncbi:hypothetical protein PtB15_8B563 [Puccinia triticina]|nr:hypothetical protein PtB15_8B563 [Puccinia triticina]
MDHLVRLLSTTSEADKSFMLVQYLAIILRTLATRSNSGSSNKALVLRLAALSKLLSDARTTLSFLLFRITFGIFKADLWDFGGSKPVQIERLQVISMLIYYPDEHLYFLASKGVLPLSPRLINKAALYSCRAWAAYTLLHFFHLREELKLLEPERRRLQALQAGTDFDTPRKPSPAVAASPQEMEGRRAALINGLIVNLAYTPLTLHWSMPKGLYGSELITGIWGLVAAVAQLRAGWKASAKSPPPPDCSDSPRAEKSPPPPDRSDSPRAEKSPPPPDRSDSPRAEKSPPPREARQIEKLPPNQPEGDESQTQTQRKNLVWSPAMEKSALDLYVKAVKEGKRCDNGFKTETHRWAAAELGKEFPEYDFTGQKVKSKLNQEGCVGALTPTFTRTIPTQRMGLYLERALSSVVCVPIARTAGPLVMPSNHQFNP